MTFAVEQQHQQQLRKRMHKHAKRQGQRPGVPTTVSQTSVAAVPTADDPSTSPADDDEPEQSPTTSREFAEQR